MALRVQGFGFGVQGFGVGVPGVAVGCRAIWVLVCNGSRAALDERRSMLGRATSHT